MGPGVNIASRILSLYLCVSYISTTITIIIAFATALVCAWST